MKGKKVSLKNKWLRVVFDALFVLYIFYVLYITLIDRVATERRIEMTPFWELRFAIEYKSSFYLKQVVYNVIMLLPLGAYLPARFSRFRHFMATVLAGFSFSLFIEAAQYITARGLCEFDDLFNNTLGCAIGYLIFRLVDIMAHKKYRNDKL